MSFNLVVAELEVERMAGLMEELKIEKVQDKKPVLDKRLPTKVSYTIKYLWLPAQIAIYCRRNVISW